MNPFRAVIFDMDGVIVNSEPLHERAFFEVMDELGYGHNHGLQFADYVGRSDYVLWQDFIAKHKPSQSLAELLALKCNRVVDIVRQTEPIFGGLLELVETLTAHWPLAVASGSERPVVNTVLSLQGLAQFFPVVVTGGDVTQGKPAPDIFLRAAQQLGHRPQNCVVIEDSKPGVAAGLAAGMQVIAITNTHPATELAEATEVVRTYPEIADLLVHAGPP